MDSFLYRMNNHGRFIEISVPTYQNKRLWVESSWNVMAHGDAREGKWRGNWRMEWVASTLHTTSEHGLSNITTAEAHTSAASSRLNWRPRRFKWIRPFCRKTKSGFCACAITFQADHNLDTHCSESLNHTKHFAHSLIIKAVGIYLSHFAHQYQWSQHTHTQNKATLHETPTLAKALNNSYISNYVLRTVCYVMANVTVCKDSNSTKT
jgi:hypothetical protein